VSLYAICHNQPAVTEAIYDVTDPQVSFRSSKGNIGKGDIGKGDITSIFGSLDLEAKRQTRLLLITNWMPLLTTRNRNADIVLACLVFEYAIFLSPVSCVMLLLMQLSTW
jgi:hypothetical protein